MKLALRLLLLTLGSSVILLAQSASRRNVIIFVADGLRYGSINAQDTPALYEIRTKGVNFENSYSLFPTFTTANASAIATGHRVGDTGDFSNTVYIGFQIFGTGNFNHAPGTAVPFIENDEMIADLNSRKNGNYLNEATLLEVARKNGFNTAAIGKIGPTVIQDIAEINPRDNRFAAPQAIVIDDSTSYNVDDLRNPVSQSIPMPKELIDRLLKLGIPLDAPARTNGYPAKSRYDNSYAGDAQKPGTVLPNTLQQQWMTEVTTQAVLPMFVDSGKPFVVVFWSRDPDATQHNQADNLNELEPGINGPSSKLGVENADRSLARLMQWLDANPKVRGNTDIFVTSDHGFATVSRRELDRNKTPTKSESARHFYYDGSNRLDTPEGFLPNGFLAIDLALALHTNLWDPDSFAPSGSSSPYKQVRLTTEGHVHTNEWDRPSHGNGFLGAAISKLDGSDAMAIVGSNGGSDLIYVPGKNPQSVRQIVKALLGFDYVSAIFVDDRYGKLPGTLPLNLIDLVGSAVMPQPDIIVAFKVFYLTPGDLIEGISVSDSSLQEGQGNHGSFGRECTWNNMAAIGPDFKQGYVDKAPVGNADITPTLARVLGLDMPAKGKLQGRVIEESLAGKPDASSPKTTPVLSDPDPDHNLRTVLFMQEFGGQKYFDSACMTTSNAVEADLCHKQ